MSESSESGFCRLVDVVRQLRDPKTGCPWDLKQTHQSLRPYVLEEAYEVVDAIDRGGMDHLKEELGDLLLQVILHSQLASDAGQFSVNDVAEGIAEKLIRRHPHVFGDVKVADAEAVTINWEKIKEAEKGGKTTSVMENLPQGVPALSKALEVSKRAVKEGFEWPDWQSLWACVMSEYDEFRAEVEADAPFENLEDELGDILFATVNLSRYHKIDPEIALNKATQKFLTRYRTMETLSDKPIREQPFEMLDTLWEAAKRQVRANATIEGSLARLDTAESALL